MKTTKLTFLGLLSGIILLGTQHLKAQSVNYKIVENDPDKRDLFIHLNPFNTQCYLSNISIGYNLQATWVAPKLFQVQVDYRKAYLDENADGVFSPNGLKKSYQLEAGGVFNLSNVRRNVSHKVVLHSSSDGKYNYTTYIMVPAEARRIIGVRGGFLSILTNHKVDNDITKPFGEGDLMGKANDGQVRYLRDTVNYETINYSARSIGVYAGLDFKIIRQLIINTDNYRKKSQKGSSNIYADILFTPSVKYELYPNAGQSYFSDVDVNISDNKRKMTGWRFGWHWIYNQGCGFNGKVEIGQQPGVPKKTFFLNAGFGMTIGVKTKPTVVKRETN